MSDCVADAGIDLPVRLGIAALLLVLAVVAIILFRRNKKGLIAALVALVIAFAVGVALVGVPTSSACTTPAATILPDQPVSFESGGITFVGSYRPPAEGTDRDVPAAVIIGGTGAVDRDGNGAGIPMEQYRWIADLLSDQGIASIRYDKVGTGATGLGPYASDPAAMGQLSYDELRIQPARDALAFLADQPGIDASQLIIVGHSEGGAAAVTIAHDPGTGPAPAGLALLEPAYTHILDILSRQFSEQMDGAAAAGAMTDADVTALKAWMTTGIEEIRTGTPPFAEPGPLPLAEPTEYTELMQTTIANNIYGADPAQMVITHAYRTLYGQGYDALDPADFAPSITIPTLITCGTKDFNTPCGDGSVGSGVIALATAFPEGVARFVELPDTVHILRDVGEDEVSNLADQIAYPFSTLLEEEFSAFVAKFRG